MKNTRLFLNFDAFIIISILFSFIFLKYEILLKIVGIVATIPVIINAFLAIKKRKISIDLLASIALIVSLIKGEWISVAFINLMITSARMFARYVEIKSRSALNSLIKIKPTKATVERNGKIIDLPIEQVKKGDLVIVELGESIPVDGIVEKGSAMVNQSSLTGESIPVLIKKGDKALSFTTVVSGNITVIAEKIGKETTFERIVELIQTSEKNKADVETLGDNFSKWYIVITVLVAIGVYIYSSDINLVLSLLLVSCADDIAVAVPLALMTAITHGAKHGAIIKGGNFIEGLSKVKVMIFDKTGTLTEGKLKVAKVVAFNDHKDKEVVYLAGTASLLSHHPVARAIIEYAKENGENFRDPDKTNEVMGKGIIAFRNKDKIITGKFSFFEELGIKISDDQMSIINQEMDKGFNVSLVSKNNELVGLLALGDILKPHINKVLKDIKKLGIKKIVMLTGDNEKIAANIAKETGIDEFHANLLPEQKIEYLKKYMNGKQKVAMVGDGVNDAPCIALADIGIAMGAIGSDTAIDSADIALMKDDIRQIPELIRIGKKTIVIIKQDLIIWGIINIVGLVLVFSHIINPAGAAVYNFATDFIPIINSLQLFR